MKRILSVLLAAGMLLALLSGCGSNSDVTVSVQSVGLITGTGSVGLMDRFAGLVEAGQTVSVEKDPDMQIKEILVTEGDEVTEGQILFAYDTETITLELEKKQLELEQLNASIETKTAQIESLEKEKKSASKSDQLDYTLQIQELQVDISEAKLNITAKEKEIQRVQKLLENAEVRSTVTGTVQSINQTTDGTDENGNPLPFMTVSETGSFRVKGTVNEQNMAALSEGTQVTIRSRVDDTVTWTGTVERIDRDNPVKDQNNFYYDGGDEMTRSSKYPFYVALDSDEGLMLGQHVYVEPGQIDLDEQLMYLPAWFIQDAETDPWVWAANSKDRLEKRKLTLGDYDPDADAWVVTGGLSPEDYIAFPDETCVQGASVVYYSEEDFSSGPDNEGEFEGGFEEGGSEGDFGEGEFEEGEFEGGFEEGEPEPGYEDVPVEGEGEEGAAG